MVSMGFIADFTICIEVRYDDIVKKTYYAIGFLSRYSETWL